MKTSGLWVPAAFAITVLLRWGSQEGRYPGDDMASAKAVLETVSWCRGRFGVSRIVEILRGSRSKALLAYGAEGLSDIRNLRGHIRSCP